MIGSFRLPINITSSGDTTAPTILSATVEDANPDKLVVVHDEVVTITNTTGLTITGAATPTLSAPTGSGSTTITFTLSTALTNGQSVTLNVDSSNTIEDAANNNLAATTRVITNNVAAVAGYDVDYQAVLDYATSQSIALPTSTQQDIDNQLLIDYKATGAWAKDDIFLKFKGTSSAAFKLICWKRRVKAVGYGGLTWSDSGVQGNGTNGYIDPLFIPNINGVNYTADNAGLIYVSTLSVNEEGVLFGSFENNNSSYVLFKTGFGALGYAFLNHGTTDNSSPNKLGVNALYRTTSTNIKLYLGDGVLRDKTVPSGYMPNQKIYLLGRNKSGVADLFSTERISYATLGGSKDTEHTAIRNTLL